MSDRQATPDVLSALMSGTAVKEESNKTLKQESNKAIKKESHKARIKQLVIEGTEEAEPVFEEELLEELEDKCHEIRKMCGSKQISKTLIVEEALRLAFVEFDLKKHLSKFYSKLESNKAVKQ
jgi:uncharacterized membrane protein YheB (UPF0754 family)